VLRRDALRAEADAGEALAAGDLDRAVEAAGRLDDALDRIQRTGAGEGEALALRRQRADFLIGFGVRLKDRALLAQALDDLTALAKRLDPDYRPLSWARVEGLRAAALAALGDLTGEPNRLAEAVRVYAAAAEHIDFDHSPLDRARLSHGLALALQSLAEAIEDEGLYDHALAAYDQALGVLDAGKAPVLRASVVHDRAACVARRAERTGDAAALARAEASFREEIAHQDAAADPVAWAVGQLSLARVYIAQAGLLGAPEPPPGAALALTEAVEVFAERGLKALVEAAQEALERLKGA
jgi:tetratricopeptide (TPR) repeat protein